MAKLPSTRVTPETLFYTASTTKAFTAAALSILIDESTSPSLHPLLSPGRRRLQTLFATTLC